MHSPTEEAIAKANAALSELLTQSKTLNLASTLENKRPHVSYAPFAIDSELNFYLFVSELSLHTKNLRERQHISMMIIEDEANASQLFARCRLTLGGRAIEISRMSSDWNKAADVYRSRFGKFFDKLSQLPDFHMFRIRPATARLVVGFGAAYEIQLPDWTALKHLKP